MNEVYCETTLNYAGTLDYEPVRVAIADGRKTAAKLDFSSAGFTSVQHQSAVQNWQDEDQLNTVHGPEVASFVTEFTGCRSAIVYPALVRSPSTSKLIADYAPIESVHSDFTEVTGTRFRICNEMRCSCFVSTTVC